MNPIIQMFEKLTDEQLAQGCEEIREDAEKGIIRSVGLVRQVAMGMQLFNQQPLSTNLISAEIGILRQAAYRFAQNYIAAHDDN